MIELQIIRGILLIIFALYFIAELINGFISFVRGKNEE